MGRERYLRAREGYEQMLGAQRSFKGLMDELIWDLVNTRGANYLGVCLRIPERHNSEDPQPSQLVEYIIVSRLKADEDTEDIILYFQYYGEDDYYEMNLHDLTVHETYRLLCILGDGEYEVIPEESVCER